MTSFVCSECGKTHDGLPALGLLHPDYWVNLSEEQQAQGECGADMCQTADGFYFVKAILVLPISDMPDAKLEYSLWASLSDYNFGRYADAYSDADQSKLGNMFAWLSNEVRGFPGSLNLKAQVWPQDNRQRPLLELEQTDHPLSVAHHRGITLSRAHELLHAYGAL